MRRRTRSKRLDREPERQLVDDEPTAKPKGEVPQWLKNMLSEEDHDDA